MLFGPVADLPKKADRSTRALLADEGLLDTENSTVLIECMRAPSPSKLLYWRWRSAVVRKTVVPDNARQAAEINSFETNVLGPKNDDCNAFKRLGRRPSTARKNMPPL